MSNTDAFGNPFKEGNLVILGHHDPCGPLCGADAAVLIKEISPDGKKATMEVVGVKECKICGRSHQFTLGDVYIALIGAY